MRLVDLSELFAPGMGGPPPLAPENSVQICQLRTAEGGGTAAAAFTLGDHVGTHIDAPSHLIAGGATISDLELSQLFGPAVVLDMRRGDDAGITVADLKGSRAIETGDIVLLETGWSRFAGTSRYRDHHPYIEPEAARWLASRAIRAIGIDASSVDLPRSLRPEGFAHETLRTFLLARIPVIHSLTNLSAVRGLRCTVVALPICFQGADGGPARVVAVLEDQAHANGGTAV